MSKVSLDLHLNRAVPTSPGSAAGSHPAAAVLRGHVNFTGVASQCCPAALWPLLATLHQLQQQLQQQQQQQQLMVQQQGTSLVLPSFGRPTEDSNEGQVRRRHHTSEEPIQDESAATVDDALGGTGLHTSQGSSNANQQPGTDAVAQEASSGEAAPAAGQEADAALSLQWEVCVQASSETQMGVVADNGVVLLGCGVEMVTLRAASGDGSSMKAQSAADIVAQLSLQVGMHMLFCMPRSCKEVLHPVCATRSVCPTLAGFAASCMCTYEYVFF
jgi:G:T/U-mismatch repair DNA glycosylase